MLNFRVYYVGLICANCETVLKSYPSSINPVKVAETDLTLGPWISWIRTIDPEVLRDRIKFVMYCWPGLLQSSGSTDHKTVGMFRARMRFNL